LEFVQEEDQDHDVQEQDLDIQDREQDQSVSCCSR
jgi:hypothetical protein